MKLKEGVATDLSGEAVREISGALRPLLAGVFALYLKTKNFHWHKLTLNSGLKTRQRRVSYGDYHD